MKNHSHILKDTLITIGILCGTFLICLVVQNIFKTEALVSAMFILGVFLTSAITQGYIYGMVASFISVFAVNFAFTFPYFKLNFTIPENLVSAIIMIVISLITCGFTTRLKHSEAIKRESEKEKMRANLLRAISHDLRTPLTSIYSAGSTLYKNRKKLTDGQQDKILTGICEDAAWLSRMVENLLSITKLDGGNVKIIKIDTALDELVDSALVKFQKRYPAQKVDINIPDDFIMIPMDALLIEQVIINILENAMQHAKGMTKLLLNVFTLSGKAIFEIQDDGCGISDEKMKHIFTGCYTPTDTSIDSNRNNAGIGLSVCATIIKAHGGDIKAENLKTGGAVFRFILDMEEKETNDQQ